MFIILDELLGGNYKECRDIVPTKKLFDKLTQICSKATKEQTNKQTHRHKQYDGDQRGQEGEEGKRDQIYGDGRRLDFEWWDTMQYADDVL